MLISTGSKLCRDVIALGGAIQQVFCLTRELFQTVDVSRFNSINLSGVVSRRFFFVAGLRETSFFEEFRRTLWL